MSKFHLRGLDTFRAFAALIVVIDHTEEFKRNYHFDFLDLSLWGHLGVVLFFTLSGYLITLLLLREQQKYETISLPKFYLRRIFRVWPLYYIVLFGSLILFHYQPSLTTFLLCLTIFPNIAHILKIFWLVSPQLWSIGVEEQFYLVWPWVVRSSKYLLTSTVVFFVIFTIFPHVSSYFLVRYYPNQALLNLIFSFFKYCKFNCMAAGAIIAVLYFNKSPLVGLLQANRVLSYALVILPFVLWLSGFELPYFNDECYTILFAISILNISTDPQLIDIDWAPIGYLGSISYGIYMYHWIVLELVFRSNFLRLDDSLVKNFLLYTSVIVSTIAIAGLSYQYIEKPLLRIKDRYSRA